MVETLSTAPSGMASTWFIGILCLCCLTLLWVFADQSTPGEPEGDQPDRPGEWPEKADWTIERRAHRLSRRWFRRVMRYVSLTIAVISLALIFGATTAFLGNKLLEAMR
jgi:hypothetical protein